MFESSLKKIDLNKKNIIISKNINLDQGLDCFILISSNDKKLWELLLNKILDSIIDKIFHSAIDNKLWVALENINSFLYTWESGNEKPKWLHAVIWVLRWNDIFFSTIWKPSCYLINQRKEVLEITDKNEKKKEFWFILNWSLKDWEIVTFSNIRLFDFLSEDDLRDGVLSGNINWFNLNIINILKWEDLTKNIWVLSFQNLIFNVSEKKKVSDILSGAMKLLDNGFVKKIVALTMVAKDKLENKSKNIKNGIFLVWILVSFFLLYVILSQVVSSFQDGKLVEAYRQKLSQFDEYYDRATENTNNADAFDNNIKKAEEVLLEIEDKKLFLKQTNKRRNDLSLLKKQFNQIESFQKSWENRIYFSNEIKDAINILKVDGKMFIVWKKFVLWPILPWVEAKKYNFDMFQDDDYFIDSASVNSDIVLLTKLWRVVNFSISNLFNYADVNDREGWKDSNMIMAYLSNIYLLTREWNQIYKHKKDTTSYSSWVKYLNDDDSQALWKILAVGIDGGFYMLKEDLSMVKFFKSPYKLENMMLNKLPENYELEDNESPIKLKTWANLNYVYMMLNKRILVFKPNTRSFTNVRSLKFLWQIEWANFEIKDFHVGNDWIITVLWEDWIYKIQLEIWEDKIRLL